MSNKVYCHECNRGGNGNDKNKCGCGWRTTEPSVLGCFGGTPIEGPIQVKPKIKISRSKQRYQRYREYGDGFRSFLDYCYWDASPERPWNGGAV
jgi:hypothetical protein